MSVDFHQAVPLGQPPKPSDLLYVPLPVAGPQRYSVSSPSGTQAGEQPLSGCAAPTAEGESEVAGGSRQSVGLDVVAHPLACGGQS